MPNMIFLVSDSVGETAEIVAKAALRQFLEEDIQLKKFPFVRDENQIDDIVHEAKLENAFIVFTLVRPETRHYFLRVTRKEGIYAIDLMGPLIEAIEKMVKKEALAKPGLARKMDKDYFQRIEAIEFAVKYDDLKDPSGILLADVVLLGISRTSKTPLSQYLANRRIKVVNVPIVPEVIPPVELFKISSKKCIGLVISPFQLQQIRKERLVALGLGEDTSYAQFERIQEELVYFDKIIREIGCPIIDVTNKAVEETASIVLSYLEQSV